MFGQDAEEFKRLAKSHAGIYSLLQYRAATYGAEYENSNGSGAKLLTREQCPLLNNAV